MSYFSKCKVYTNLQLFLSPCTLKISGGSRVGGPGDPATSEYNSDVTDINYDFLISFPLNDVYFAKSSITTFAYYVKPDSCQQRRGWQRRTTSRHRYRVHQWFFISMVQEKNSHILPIPGEALEGGISLMNNLASRVVLRFI